MAFTLGIYQRSAVSFDIDVRLRSTSALCVREARDEAVSKRVYEEAVVVADDFGVVSAEIDHFIYELFLFSVDDRDDLILRLEADEGRVGVFIGDAVDFGRRPAEVV